MGDGAASSPPASPDDSRSDVGFTKIQFHQFGAQPVAALGANRSQDDLPLARFDIKVFRRAAGRSDALGQGQLVLDGQLREHWLHSESASVA